LDSNKQGSRKPLKSVGKRKGTGQDGSGGKGPKGLFKPRKPFEGKRDTASQKRLFTARQGEGGDYPIKPAAGGRPVQSVDVNVPKSPKGRPPVRTTPTPKRPRPSSGSGRHGSAGSGSLPKKPGIGAQRVSRMRKQPSAPIRRRQAPEPREEVSARPASKRAQAPAHLSPTRKPPSPQQFKHLPKVDTAEDAIRKKAVPYQWGQTAKFSADQKKFLERVFTQFAENVTTKMAPLLQTRVNITYDNAKLRPYSTFIQSLYEPIALLILRMDPETKGLIVIDFPLSFALIDRCLGGSGQSLEEIRYFTDIEIAVLERVVVRLIESYQEALSEIRECKPQYLEMQFNPQTVHIVKPSETMVCVTFDVQVIQASGPIYVIIPFEYLKSVLPKSNFEEFMLTRSSPSQVSPSVAPLFVKNLDAAKVPVSVELGSTELPFGELAILEVGDFIKLDQEITEPLKVKVNDRIKFLGRPGVRERKMSVQITKVLQEGDEELDEQ